MLTHDCEVSRLLLETAVGNLFEREIAPEKQNCQWNKWLCIEKKSNVSNTCLQTAVLRLPRAETVSPITLNDTCYSWICLLR